MTILFAIFREAVFIPLTDLNDTLARALLLPVGIFYTFAITYIFFKKTKFSYQNSTALKIGFLWLILTLVFEFTFGSLVMGNSLTTLIADYDITTGRTWSLFLLGVFLAPIIVGKLINKKNQYK